MISTIKNIFFVSYLKNKGVRRICFVVGIGILIYLSYVIFLGIIGRRIDVEYKNLQDLNDDYYFRYSYINEGTNISKVTYEYLIETECLAINLKKYGIDDQYIAHAFSSYKNILESSWCDYYQDKCDILKSIKEKPIHVKCNGIESGYFNTISGLLFRFLVLLLGFYIPFIFACCTKIMYIFIKRIVLWIYAGFKEK